MNEPMIPYFNQLPGAYPKVTAKFFGSGTESGSHNTLEGEMQEFVDGFHYTLRRTWGDNPTELDGAVLYQSSLAYALNELKTIAFFYPRFYRDTVLPGQTVDGLLKQYQDEARKVATAYGITA